MAIYPIEIRRCRHIKTNGTQCGSPAVKDKELCYYHEKNQPKTVELYIDGERYSDSQLWLPVFEDAYSIQTVIRQVVQLLLARRIERKDASLLLYALQIASSNLKTMQAEKAKPTQVVVEPEKAAETPLGMTQWSANGRDTILRTRRERRKWIGVRWVVRRRRRSAMTPCAPWKKLH